MTLDPKLMGSLDPALRKLLEAVDHDTVAQLYLKGIKTKSHFIGLIAELGKLNGCNLDKGDFAIIHPDNVPEHLRGGFTPADPVKLSLAVAPDQILFSNNQR